MKVRDLSDDEIIDLLPDQFMLSFGRDDEHKFMFGRTERRIVWSFADFTNFTRHGFDSGHTHDILPIVRWLKNGDHINLMSLQDYLDSIEISAYTPDISIMSSLL